MFAWVEIVPQQMDDFLGKPASLELFVCQLKAFKNLETYTENSVIQQNQLFTGMLEGNSEEVGTKNSGKGI